MHDQAPEPHLKVESTTPPTRQRGRKDRSLASVPPGGSGPTRHEQLGGDVFLQHPPVGAEPAQVTLVKYEKDPNDPGGKLIPREQVLFSGTLTVPAVYTVRGVTDDSLPSAEIETSDYQVEYTAPDGSVASTAVDDAELGVTGRDARKWTRRIGLGLYLNRPGASMVDHAVRAFATDAHGIPHPQPAYSSTGLIKVDGRHAFLRANRPALTGTGQAPELITRLPAGLFRDATWAEVLSYPDPSPEDEAGQDALALWAIRNAAPGVPVIDALLCQLVMAPRVGLREVKPTIWTTHAGSGTGKGILQALLVALQANGVWVPTAEVWDPPALNGADRLTSLALRSRLHFLRGYMVPIVDLFQEGQTARDRDAAWAKLNMAARSAADGSAGGAMQRNGTDARADRMIRACVAFDAEELPDAAKRPGALGRSIVARLEGDPFQVEAAKRAGLASRPELDAIYASLPRAGRTLGSILAAGLADLDAHGTGAASALRAALEWGRETAAGWRIDGHARGVSKYGQLLAGAYLLGEHLGQVADMDPAKVRDELAESVQCIAAAQAAEVARPSRVRREHGKDVDNWVRGLRRLMQDSDVLVAGTAGPDSAPETGSLPEGRSMKVYGWRKQTTGLGVPEWVPHKNMEPIGAVHGEPKQAGRRPKFAESLWMFADGFDRLHAIVKAAADRVGVALPDASQMRAAMTEAEYLMPPEKAELWGSDTQRVTKLDIGRVLTLDDEQTDEQDAPETSGQDTKQTPPATKVPEQRAAEPVQELPAAVELPIPEPAVCGGEKCGFPAGTNASDVLQDGQWWHKECLDGTELALVAERPAQPEQPPARAVSTPAQPTPGDDTRQEVPTRQRRAQQPRKPIVGRANPPAYALKIPQATELRNFAHIIVPGEGPNERGERGEMDQEALAEGLDLFHRVTDWTGLESKSRGQMGNTLFWRLTKRSSSTPEPQRWDLPEDLGLEDRQDRTKLLDPMWVNPDRVPAIGGPPLLALDVYGQFLAAAGMYLPTGLPRRVGPLDSAAELVTRDGKSVMSGEIGAYGWLAEDIDAPGILTPLRAGDRLAAPTLRYLVEDLRLHVPLADAWVWDENRPWLHSFYEHWRDARNALLHNDELSTKYARSAVKAIPNAFISGWLRSRKHNYPSATYQPAWSEHVIARARVNSLRHIRKSGIEAVALIADTAYFLGWEEANRMQIDEIKKQLGKWKVEHIATVTPEIVAAHASGRTAKFRKAVNAAPEPKDGAR